ncbi:MAG TPA: glutamine amidotransferase [Vineibacter sp.]|nr:glutamine amidotransferase [Vineibacter sp.]
MKRACVIRHLAFEDLGILAPVLAAHGYDIAYREAGVDDIGPALAAATDLLVVLGGPIGAYEDASYPYLTGELQLIERCLRNETPVLGICLGAQLMARALGTKVYPGTKEIGFSPITLTETGRRSCLRWIDDADGVVLHWHGDTFDLPDKAERLASTPATPNQAFIVGRHALALQFHLEADPAGFERWLIGHTAELAAAKISVPSLRAAAAAKGAATAHAGRKVFDAWLGTITTA